MLLPLSTLRVSEVSSVYIHTPAVTLKHKPQTPQAPAAIIAEKCRRVTTLHISGVFLAETIAPFTACQTLKVTHESTWGGEGLDANGHPKLFEAYLLPQAITTLEIAPAPICPIVILNHQVEVRAAAEADAAQAASPVPDSLKHLSDFCSQLASHHTLTVLLLGDRSITTEDWNRFPAAIRLIEFGLIEPIVSNKICPVLDQAIIHSCSFRNPLSLSAFASVLHLAPRLTYVKLAKPRGAKYYSESDNVFLTVPCREKHIPELQLLKTRLIGGNLSVDGGVHLLFVSTKGIGLDVEGDHHIYDFLGMIPLRLPCTSLLLESSLADEEERFLPKGLEIRLPGLVTLGILSTQLIETVDLSRLVYLKSLTHLSLATRDEGEYDAVALTLLGSRLQSLEVVQLQEHGTGMEARVQQHQAVLQEWNSPVQLRMYHDKRILQADNDV